MDGFVPGNPIRARIVGSSGETIELSGYEENQYFGQNAYSSISLKSKVHELPAVFHVGKAYPNPFNSAFSVPVGLPRDGNVSISIYNILGQLKMKSVKELKAGYHRVLIDGENLVSGIYFVQVALNGQSTHQKVILLK